MIRSKIQFVLPVKCPYEKRTLYSSDDSIAYFLFYSGSAKDSAIF